MRIAVTGARADGGTSVLEGLSREDDIEVMAAFERRAPARTGAKNRRGSAHVARDDVSTVAIAGRKRGR